MGVVFWSILSNYIVIKNENKIKGSYYTPSSKSHSFRALLLSLQFSNSIIYNLLKSDDVDNFVDIIKSLGFIVIENNNELKLKKPHNIVIKEHYDFKNSGTALRFMVTYLSLLNDSKKEVLLDGDKQLKNRKIKELLLSLEKLGLEYKFKTKKEIPFYINNKIKHGTTRVSGKSSQFLSSLLLNLSFADGKSIVYIDELNEKPYIDMTLYHLRRIGGVVDNLNYKKMIIHPVKKVDYFEYSVPGDFSSATFLILSSVLSKGELDISNLDVDDTQGDKKILEYIRLLGCNYTISNNGALKISGDVNTSASFDMNDTPDMLPALVFFLAQYPYSYQFTNLESIRFKETDRVKVLYDNLINMGINAVLLNDKLSFTGKALITSPVINAMNDHRIIMAASLLGMKKGSSVKIYNIENLSSSYPDYFSDIKKVGFTVEYF